MHPPHLLLLLLLLPVPTTSAVSSCHTNADCHFPHGVCGTDGACHCYIPFLGATCNRTAPQCMPDTRTKSCDHCDGYVLHTVGCWDDDGGEWNCDVGYGPNRPNTTACSADGVCAVPPQRSCVAAVNATGTPVCVLPYNSTQSAECCGRWGCGCPQTAACDGPQCYENTKACPARQGCPQNGGGFNHDNAKCSMM